MSRHQRSLPPKYFEDMFQATDNPWDLGTSRYEREKYAQTIEALGDRHYENALEVGCAKGVLTRQIAERCNRLLAVDVSDTALEAARATCDAFDHVRFANLQFPRQTPASVSFDLILLSEVVYYWDDEDIVRAGRWISSRTAIGGDILLVHWTGETDYPQTGDAAVTKLMEALSNRVRVLKEAANPYYRLDLWRHVA